MHRLFAFTKKYLVLPLFLSSVSWSFNLTQYSDVLDMTTKFYGAQRSGTVDNWIIQQYPAQNRNACFPQDGVSYQAGLDLSGGWHDAGDNIKFTLTIAFSAYALLKSYDAFPLVYPDKHSQSYGAANGVPDILDEVKWATDYLMKIHLNATTLVSQIGDYRDHDQGLTCPTMTGQSTANGGDPRTVWFGASNSDVTQTKADILGITAATLALMGKLYQPYDPTYATSCISHATDLYATAKTRLGTTNEPAGQSYYKDDTYIDDLACGAVELYRATGTASYITEAVNYSNQFSNHNWVVDWATHIDYCRHSIALAGRSADVQTDWKNDVDNYRSKVSSSTYVNGLAFFSDWGSLRYAANAAFSAALYHEIYTDAAAQSFAISQLDYIMGTNEYNRSFIVGFGTNPPQNPHHKNAFGKDEWFNTSSVPLYALTGALVGGPHTNNYSDGSLTSPPGYQDIMTDYISNEVTVDYNSGLVGVTAFAVKENGGAVSSSSASSSSTVSSSSAVSSSIVVSSSSASSSSEGTVGLVERELPFPDLSWNVDGALLLSLRTATTLEIESFSILGHRLTSIPPQMWPAGLHAVSLGSSRKIRFVRVRGVNFQKVLLFRPIR